MTTLTFLGTKGEIEESALRHKYHASLMVESKKVKILIDYGEMYKFKLEDLKPKAIFITHAHPDHYVWLNEDIKTDIPVYLTKETFEYGKFKPKNYKIIKPSQKIVLEDFEITSYRVIHSIRCPAVGFKIITPEGKILIYNPDLVDIVGKEKILKDVDWYIGDGSSIRANLVRFREGKIFGHARITTQINWFKNKKIPKIIFTHLGKETIEYENDLKKQYPDIILAYNGMKIRI